MKEEKDSEDKLMRLINNDISLIVGVPSAPVLNGMSVADDYEFLKLFFPVDPDTKIMTRLYSYSIFFGS